jgi:hypothetical protein
VLSVRLVVVTLIITGSAAIVLISVFKRELARALVVQTRVYVGVKIGLGVEPAT